MTSSHAGVGGPNIPPPDDGRDRRVRRQRARRPDPRAALRPRRRAHPRLQHGVPEVEPARRSAASTRSSASPATTSTSAGGCRSRAGRSASAPARSSGTTAATRCAPTGSSSSATARPRRCSSASGPSGTTASGHLAWAGRLYGSGRSQTLRWRPLADLLRRLGHGPVPVASTSRAPGILGVAAADARVVPGDRGAGALSALGHRLAAAAARAAAADRGDRRARVRGRRSAARTRTVRAARRSRAARAPDAAASPTCLYLLQPAARLGRAPAHGLSPWRRRSAPRLRCPVPRTTQHLERALALARRARCGASRRRCAAAAA